MIRQKTALNQNFAAAERHHLKAARKLGARSETVGHSPTTYHTPYTNSPSPMPTSNFGRSFFGSTFAQVTAGGGNGIEPLPAQYGQTTQGNQSTAQPSTQGSLQANHGQNQGNQNRAPNSNNGDPANQQHPNQNNGARRKEYNGLKPPQQAKPQSRNQQTTTTGILIDDNLRSTES